MRLPPNRPSGLMASTTERPRLEGDSGERHRTCSNACGDRPARVDDLGRARALGRPHRARGRGDRRQRDPRRRPELAQLHRLVRGHRPDLPGGSRGRRTAAEARVEGVDRDRARLVLRAVRGRRARRVLRARLEPPAGGDRRPRALHDEPRSRVRRARRDRAQPRAGREAADVRDVRHRHRHRHRADGAVPQADAVDRAVRRRVRRPDLRSPAARRSCSSRATGTA